MQKDEQTQDPTKNLLAVSEQAWGGFSVYRLLLPANF